MEIVLNLFVAVIVLLFLVAAMAALAMFIGALLEWVGVDDDVRTWIRRRVFRKED